MDKRIPRDFFLEGPSRRNHYVEDLGYHTGPGQRLRGIMQFACWIPFLYVNYQVFYLGEYRVYNEERWRLFFLIIIGLWMMGFAAKDFGTTNPGVWKEFWRILGVMTVLLIAFMVIHAVYRHLRDDFGHHHHDHDDRPMLYRY